MLFKHAVEEQRELIRRWLKLPHIAKWIHGIGLQNTYASLDAFFKKSIDMEHWIAYDGDVPFAYLLTSYLQEGESLELPAITLDLFICDLNYLGKKLSCPMITEFLKSQFPQVKAVYIDPEVTNMRAIRAYEKVGFRVIREFIAPWHPVPHFQMKMRCNFQ